MSTVRWIFTQGEDSWTLPMNPRTMSSPHPQKQVIHSVNAYDGRAVTRVGAQRPVEFSFGGPIRTQEHYEGLEAWAKRSGKVWITDHLGRTFEVMIQSYEPEDRKPTFNHRWRSKYTMKTLLLREGLPPAPDPDPPSDGVEVSPSDFFGGGASGTTLADDSDATVATMGADGVGPDRNFIDGYLPATVLGGTPATIEYRLRVRTLSGPQTGDVILLLLKDDSWDGAYFRVGEVDTSTSTVHIQDFPSGTFVDVETTGGGVWEYLPEGVTEAEAMAEIVAGLAAGTAAFELVSGGSGLGQYEIAQLTIIFKGIA